jgi:integrase
LAVVVWGTSPVAGVAGMTKPITFTQAAVRRVRLVYVGNRAFAASHGREPGEEVKRVKYATEGFHTWTEEEVRQFEARHPLGTKPRLALAMLMFTGTRRSDIVHLGPANVTDGWVRFIPRKMRHKRKAVSQKPWLPVLADIVAASPTGAVTYPQTEYGKPFTADGFGNWFRDRCDEAGLPQCSAHGLHKAGASLAAERGATIHQLMAIFDWSSPTQAKVYTDAADRERLAGDAMSLLAERNKR